jgi:hypothetical protein
MIASLRIVTLALVALITLSECQTTKTTDWLNGFLNQCNGLAGGDYLGYAGLLSGYFNCIKLGV